MTVIRPEFPPARDPEPCPVCGRDATGIETFTVSTMLCAKPTPGREPGEVVTRILPCGCDYQWGWKP